MSIKSIVIFLLVIGAIVWFVGREPSTPAKPPASLVAGQQKQMEKASNLGKQMQSDLDQRMKSTPSAE